VRTYEDRIANIKAKARATKKAYGAMAVSVTAMLVLTAMICGVVFGPVIRHPNAPTDGPGLMQPTMSDKDPTSTTDTPTEPMVTEPADPLPTNTTEPIPTEPTQPTEPPKSGTVVHAFVLEETRETAEGASSIITYERDENGNVIRMTRDGLVYTAVYSVNGQLTQLIDEYGNKTTYVYDHFLNLIEEKCYVNDELVSEAYFSYGYDDRGRVAYKSYVAQEDRYQIEYQYHKNGKVAQKHTYCNGVLVEWDCYDQTGRLTEHKQYREYTGDLLYTETYQRSGNSSTADRIGSDGQVGATITYTYDEYGNVLAENIRKGNQQISHRAYTYLYMEEYVGTPVEYSYTSVSDLLGSKDYVVVFRSQKELEERYGEDSALALQYGDAFFSEKTLMLIILGEHTPAVRHQVAGVWKDENGDYHIKINQVYTGWGESADGHGTVWLVVHDLVATDAEVTLDQTLRIISDRAMEYLYGKQFSTEVILPEKPDDYTLEYWIGQDVSHVDWSKKECFMDGETVDLYMGQGYSCQVDDQGNRMLPSEYVYYKVTTLPDGRKFITEIAVGDPSIVLFGLTMQSSSAHFSNVFDGVDYYRLFTFDRDPAISGRGNCVIYAVKDGIKIWHHYNKEIVISVDNLSFTEKEPEPVVPVESVVYWSEGVKTTEGSIAGLQPRVIRSVAELQAFLDTYYQPNCGFENVQERARRYNDAFFETKTLIVMMQPEDSGSNRLCVSDVHYMTDDSIQLTIQRIMPGTASTDQAYWYIFVEVRGVYGNQTHVSEKIVDVSSQNFNPYSLGAKVPSDTQQQIKDAFAAQLEEPLSTKSLNLTFYGIFEDAYALFVNSWSFYVFNIPTVETIHGLDFYYQDIIEMCIYADGHFYSLTEAVQRGIICVADLCQLYCDYYAYRPDWQEGWGNALPLVMPEGEFDDQALLSEIPQNVQINIRQTFLDMYLNSGEPYTTDDLSLRVFGVFGDTYAVFVDGVIPYSEIYSIDSPNGYKFYYPTTQKLLIYRGGELVSLHEGYKNGWITEEQLRTIYVNYYMTTSEFFTCYQMSGLQEAPEPTFDPQQMLEQISDITQQQVRQDFVEQFADPEEYDFAEDISLRVFGVFGDTYALFVDGIFSYPQAPFGDYVNGIYFHYPDYQRMYIYADGHFHCLQEAYDAELLTIAQIMEIYENYYGAYPQFLMSKFPDEI